MLARGDACAQASYKLLTGLPWGDNGKAITSVEVAADMASFSLLNLCYWFNTCTNIAEFSRLANLAGVRSMNFAFASCSGVGTLDLRGFDPSYLTTMNYAFASCSAMTTILVDSTWALPSGASGSQTFYNDKALVGGNGTAWSSSNVSYKYCVIDAAGSPGYLTAA